MVNYKKAGKDLLAAVRAAAPKGIDIYFDNVGGDHLEVALEVARPFARFIECGMISALQRHRDPRPARATSIYVVGKRITHAGLHRQSITATCARNSSTEMTQWIKDGKIKWEETVENGIENAPKAFLNLFSGANTGKMLVEARLI